MRTWIQVLLNEGRALRDAIEHLEALAKEEDSLSRVKTVDQLQYQRGKVDGIRAIRFLLTNAKEG